MEVLIYLYGSMFLMKSYAYRKLLMHISEDIIHGIPVEKEKMQYLLHNILITSLHMITSFILRIILNTALDLSLYEDAVLMISSTDFVSSLVTLIYQMKLLKDQNQVRRILYDMNLDQEMTVFAISCLDIKSISVVTPATNGVLTLTDVSVTDVDKEGSSEEEEIWHDTSDAIPSTSRDLIILPPLRKKKQLVVVHPNVMTKTE
jgi:hypothetical protein